MVSKKLLPILVLILFSITSNAQLGGLIKKRQKAKNTSTSNKNSKNLINAKEESRDEKTYREIERIKYADLYNFDGSEFLVKELKNDSIAAVKAEEKKEEKLKIDKISKSFPKLKYRRSSLYTLMVDDKDRQFANNIANAFGNFPILEKFNEHNVGSYLIEGHGGDKEQLTHIKEFLKKNQIAKKLVARWFNRSKKGGFDMNLISERGFYSASDLDIKNANNNQKGLSIIADAGEELIKNTFIIVNDYKFTNKEEVAKKVSGLLKNVAALTGNSSMTAISDGVTALGKGYVIKTKSYLFKLDWNDKIANTFYTQHWTDDNSLDIARKEDFEKSQIFKLKFIGVQGAYADVQSTVFSNKSNKDLIIKATIKASDKAMHKLQKKYEEFRTKTPLYSTEPLTAKIGTKEGVFKGEKYEVLEQIINSEGKTEYKRKAIIKVDGDKIWNNSFGADKEETEQDIHETHFKGSSKNLYSGMLIRQIN